jgi:hypothetical protein
MALKPCSDGKVRNEKTKRCIKEKTSSSKAPKSKASTKTTSSSNSDARAKADIAIMKDIQNQYMLVRIELVKMEKERDKFRDAYENMVRTMAKCHEDLKLEKRR